MIAEGSDSSAARAYGAYEARRWSRKPSDGGFRDRTAPVRSAGSVAQRRAVAVRGAPDQQHDDGSDDRADDAGRLERAVVRVVVEDHVAEEATDERPHDA